MLAQGGRVYWIRRESSTCAHVTDKAPWLYESSARPCSPRAEAIVYSSGSTSVPVNHVLARCRMTRRLYAAPTLGTGMTYPNDRHQLCIAPGEWERDGESHLIRSAARRRSAMITARSQSSPVLAGSREIKVRPRWENLISEQWRLSHGHRTIPEQHMQLACASMSR